MTYDNPSQSARAVYDDVPREPRRDEQAEAAESRATPPAGQTAARRTRLRSSVGNAAVAAAGCRSPEHRDGPPAATIQPAGMGRGPPPPATGVAADHSSFSAGIGSRMANRCPWRLASDSRSTPSLKA